MERHQIIRRRLELRRLIGPCLGRVDQRRIDRREIAATLQIGLSQTLDHCRRWIVGDEMARQLHSEMPRRLGCQGQITQHGFALLHAILRVALLEYRLCSWLMNRRAEHKSPRPDTIALTIQLIGTATQRPTRDHLGKVGHVGLGIAAVDPQRVQLENFPRQIFVQPQLAPLRIGGQALLGQLRRRRIRSDGQLIVQKLEHRRVFFDRQKHIGEITQYMWPDRLTFETPGQPENRHLVDGNGEMVAPEVHQPLHERPIGGNGIA